MIPREALIEKSREVYRSFGFLPIETPALEYAEILCGKGGEEADRQMFRFEDHGNRDVGMRFDLTVPLARYVAQHANELGMPFKRYHIATVWRGEKPQAGRYREFVQCDFDTIGSTSVATDIETALVIFDLMRALGFENKFQIRVNNRKVLNGMLDKLGLAQQSAAVLRVLDKLDKIGPDQVQSELLENVAASPDQVRKILELAALKGTNKQILDKLNSLCIGSEMAELGVAQLRQLVDAAKAVGVSEKCLTVDVSIARGLDYYTGTIYETFLNDLPRIGSVCSGGRYDNLADLFTNQKLPGVGASLGLDRLLAAMETLGLIPSNQTTADVLIVQFDAKHLVDYLKLAAALRAGGIRAELFPEAKKIAQQFKYADRRGFRAVVVAGGDELARQVVQVKWMADGKQDEIPLSNTGSEIIECLRRQIR